MKTVLRTFAVLAGMGVAGAGAVVGLGLYNVSAQAGHLPGVSWLLHTTFRNSVRLRAPSMEKAPPLGDPRLIALGAAHYATACAFCHADAGDVRSATVRAMVPPPPPVREAVARWQPNEMHWIVENGVKMTGMPGWPVKKRGDEVWAVAAYLAAVKQDAAPPLPGAQEGAAYCKACHESIGGPVPRLDIQGAVYLEAQLDAYLSGARPSGIMAHAVSLVPKESFGALARELAAGDVPAWAGKRPAAEGVSAGEALARRGTRDIPACLACHSHRGPALFGQAETYLANQLKLWRDGVYGHDRLMHAASRDLEDADIAALAAYFATSEDPQ